MKDYREFEEKVKMLSGQFEEWKHVLPAVQHGCRQRYITAIHSGLGMPEAFDTVMLCKDAEDSVFNQILQKLSS